MVGLVPTMELWLYQPAFENFDQSEFLDNHPDWCPCPGNDGVDPSSVTPVHCPVIRARQGVFILVKLYESVTKRHGVLTVDFGSYS